MSDQHPEHGIPPVGEPPQDLAPPPAEVPPRKERAKVRLTAMAGLLVVAAVGFGNYVPRTLEPNAAEPPRSSRVEILLFTPRG